MEKVQVLLSTYNGEKYLKEQIESIIRQEEVELSILIRDDGSNDKTIQILTELAEKYNNITFYQGENLGPARSFMELVKYSEDDVSYYAFADQDDVWKSKKMITAIQKLQKHEEIPSLYISAVEIVDENLNSIGIKKVVGNPTLEGAIIKNFAYGCTQVLNKKMRDIINQYEPNYLIMHDSWITRICYAIGGNVIIDENSYIQYRQHTSNVVGAKEGGLKKLKKQLTIAFKDNICMRVKIAEELKNGYGDILTDHAKELIEKLICYPTNKEAKKWLLRNKNFRTSDAKINAKMKLAIRLNKF